MLLVYYTSSSGFTGKFVESLGLKNLRIPVSVKEVRDFEVSEPYILISPTYGGGSPGIKDKTYIPKQVQTFLSNPRNRSLLRATIGAGQANFGDYWFCKSARDIALRHNVPYLGGFELSGLPGEDTHILKKIKEFDSGMSHKESSTDYIEFNASLNLWSYDEDGKEYIDFGKDKEAARQYHLQYVNKHTQYFPSLEDKLDYLFDNDYYVRGPFDKFNFEELKGLYKQAYTFKHRFTSFLGAMKFYSSYALRSNDGKTILERFEDRVVANAVLLSEGDLSLAQDLVDEIISGRLQPATPTFSNACKKRSGELVSCFLISSQDSMSSIARILHSALQLSKMGGGVGVDLSSIRADGDPIKGISGQASGVLPVAKLLDDSFSYANQLGQRAGAGVVYLSVVHPDFTTLLDAKRANADEKIRLKTISIGAVIPDVVFELAKRNEDLQQFSPHDIYKVYGKELSYIDMDEEYYKILNDSRIRKVSKVNARKLFTLIAQTQSESGYPYLMFSGAVDRANPITDGRAVMSNLCVTGDTRLLTDKGYKTALELFESQEDFNVVSDNRAVSLDLGALGVSTKKSTKMFKTATDSEVYEVVTKSGYKIKATEWHKFFTSSDGRISKVPLAELSVGDKLLIQHDKGAFGDVNKPELAYISGCVAADGVYQTTSLVGGGDDTSTQLMRMDFYGEKSEIAEDFASKANKVLSGREDLLMRDLPLGVSVNYNAMPKKAMVSSRALARLLFENGYYPDKSKLSVPEFVFRGNEATVKSFIEGVYRFDGCVVSNNAGALSVELVSISRTFLEDIQILLSMFGIYSKIFVSNTRRLELMPDGKGGLKEYTRKDSWSLRVVGKNDVKLFMDNFSLRPQQVAKYDKYCSTRDMSKVYKTHRFTSEIVSIRLVSVEDVYDVTVEDGHSVIFNGIVTGNCSEILQSQQPSVVNEDGTYATVGRDVSCNLASLNITKAMRGGNLEKTVDTAIRGLTAVSDLSNIDAVPTVKRANNELHSVGLGAFSLHEFFLSEGISYASQVPGDTYGNTGLRHASAEVKDFTNIYFMVVNYLALKTSNDLARHRSETFVGFESSRYADPEYLKTKYSQEDHILPGETSKRIFSKYGITIPTYEDWAKLADDIAEYGLYNAYLQAVPPTGSISYINGGTSSIHPAVAVIEGRKEGKVGKVYYATPGVTNENRSQFEDAYEVGPVAIIDVYAEAQKHIDQALSLTLFYTEDHTTRTYNQMYKYAHSKSLKTLYYARVRSNNVEGTSIEECVSCTL